MIHVGVLSKWSATKWFTMGIFFNFLLLVIIWICYICTCNHWKIVIAFSFVTFKISTLIELILCWIFQNKSQMLHKIVFVYFHKYKLFVHRKRFSYISGICQHLLAPHMPKLCSFYSDKKLKNTIICKEEKFMQFYKDIFRNFFGHAVSFLIYKLSALIVNRARWVSNEWLNGYEWIVFNNVIIMFIVVSWPLVCLYTFQF